MDEFCALLDHFWLTKQDDKDLFYAVKRAEPKYRAFLNNQLGWNLIMNEAVVKLEKVPSRGMAWMGIEDFREPLDYCLLCAVLLYLADQDDGAQFLLSDLTAGVETVTREICPVDWTRFSHRKSLVRVLSFAEQIGMLVVYDGRTEGFGADREQEVLYESTGLCHYFTVHFGRDIMDCHSVEDFEKLYWEGDDANARRHRVYRQLILAPGLYWDEDRGEYEYLKNQHGQIESRLEDMMGGRLQIYRNGAFQVLEEGERVGSCFPNTRGLTSIALLLCARLRERVLEEVYDRTAGDFVPMTRRDFIWELGQCQKETGAGWTREFRSRKPESVAEELIPYMAGWMLLEDRGDTIVLTPAAARWCGAYPQRFFEEKGEDPDEPLEDS